MCEGVSKFQLHILVVLSNHRIFNVTVLSDYATWQTANKQLLESFEQFYPCDY